jgi:hypothetical protein
MQQYGYHAGMRNAGRVLTGVAAVLAFTAVPGCGSADSATPVATVSLTPSKRSVALGGVIDLTYRFQVAPDARISGDYVVFSHLTREDGTMIWNDDHQLPAGLTTSQWKPGQVIEYTRTRFVPTLSYLGPATFEGCTEDERLPLSGPNAAARDSPPRAYKVATLDLMPRSERIQVYRLSGWHGPEFAPDDPTIEWQWTQKVATLSLRNPKSDVTLFFEYDARSDLAGGTPQQVKIYCGDTQVASFAASARVPTLERIPVTAAQLGGGEMTEFRIELDRTFIPARLADAGSDTRELGIRVFHTHVEPR